VIDTFPGEGAFGASPQNPTLGTAGGEVATEGTAFTGTSTQYGWYPDSTLHCFDIIDQTTNIGCAVGETAIIAATAIPKALGTTSKIAASAITDNGTTTAIAEAATIGTTDGFAVNARGLVTTSNALTTAGQGFPVILGVTSQKSETTTADANVLTVTPAAVIGTYRVCAVISVSAVTSGVISWTDPAGTAQSNIAQDLFQQATSAPATTFTTSAAGNYNGCSVINVNNAAAAIIVTWVGGGTCSGKMTAVIEKIN
jgi:hypothetical protein